MRTICPSCDTAYTIPDDRIGSKGRKVRCTRCGEQWRVTTADLDPIETFRAEAVDPDEGLVEASSDAVGSEAAAEIDPFDALPNETETREPSPRETEMPDADAIAAPSLAELAAATVPAETVAPAAKTKAPPPPRRVDHRARHWAMPRMPAALTRATPFLGPAVFLCSCLLVAGLVVFRAALVVQAPALAGFYRLVGLEVNLRGLDFGPIETLREMDNGQPVLVVEGSLANTSGTAREVPALRFALRDADAQELYAWSVDPRATVIAAGDRLRFRTRLVAPPDRAADLQVRFAERRNRQAGLP